MIIAIRTATTILAIASMLFAASLSILAQDESATPAGASAGTAAPEGTPIPGELVDITVRTQVDAAALLARSETEEAEVTDDLLTLLKPYATCVAASVWITSGGEDTNKTTDVSALVGQLIIIALPEFLPTVGPVWFVDPRAPEGDVKIDLLFDKSCEPAWSAPQATPLAPR